MKLNETNNIISKLNENQQDLVTVEFREVDEFEIKRIQELRYDIKQLFGPNNDSLCPVSPRPQTNLPSNLRQLITTQYM
jgi:hypothetical protein